MSEWSMAVALMMSREPYVKSIKLNGEMVYNGSEKKEKMRGMRREEEHGIRPGGEVVRRLSDFDEERVIESASSGEVDLSGGGAAADAAVEIHTLPSGEGPVPADG